MAKAHVWVRILAVALAGYLGFAGSAAGQAPVTVDERPIPPSPTGELGEAEVARAVAMIRDLGSTLGDLAVRRGGIRPSAEWTLYHDTYHRAADRLDALRTGGQIAVRPLAGGQAAERAGEGMVLDPILGGLWQAEQVRVARRLGGGDWPALSRLAGVLIAQLAAQDKTVDWDAWANAHDPSARLPDLAGEAPGPQLRPLLLRFWHIQDKYVANALSAAGTGRTGGQLGRAAALSNEMLSVLRQAEDLAGWRWRRPLETLWRESVEQTSALAGTLAPPVPAAAPEPPRAAAFDELFTASPTPPETVPPPATAADVDELRDDMGALREEAGGLRADVETLGSETKSLRADAEGLRGDSQRLRSDVEALGSTANDLRADVDTVGADTRSLRTEIEGVRGETGDLRAGIETLGRETRDLRAGARILGDDTKSLRADVDAFSGDAKSLRAGLGALGDDTKSLRTQVDILTSTTESLRAEVAVLDQASAENARDFLMLEAELRRQSEQVEALAASIAAQGRQLASLAADVAAARSGPAALDALATRQAALEQRLADLNREVGPEGLPSQLAELRTALQSEQSRTRDSEQRLEARLQDRLQALGRDIEVTRQLAKDLQSRLTAARRSATAVVVPLHDEAARRSAFRQAVVAGVALFALFVAAIAFWLRAARLRAAAATEVLPDEPAAPVAAVPRPAEDTALRDELARLRKAVASERDRAGAVAERMALVTASLAESQARARRLEADMAALRTDTRTVGRGLIDGVARDQAMRAELAQLRQAIDAERGRAAELQARIDDLKAVAAAPAVPAKPPLNGADQHAPAADVMQPKRPTGADDALRRRAIEALHRGDLAAFEQAFAELTVLPLPMIEAMVGDPSGHDLALACRAAQIAKPHFAAILVLNRRSRPGESRQAPHLLAQAMSRFDETTAEEADQALRAWQTSAPPGDRWADKLI